MHYSSPLPHPSTPQPCLEHLFTLRQLGAEGGGDGDEALFPGAVVHRHLLALAKVLVVAVALVHEVVQREAAVHQHA